MILEKKGAMPYKVGGTTQCVIGRSGIKGLKDYPAYCVFVANTN